MNAIAQWYEKHKKEFLSHIKPEIQARRELGTPITWTEWSELRMNSYERQWIIHLIDNETLLRTCLHYLSNSQYGHDPITKDSYSLHCPSTYDAAIQQILMPILIERLSKLTNIDPYPPKYIPTHPKGF